MSELDYFAGDRVCGSCANYMPSSILEWAGECLKLVGADGKSTPVMAKEHHICWVRREDRGDKVKKDAAYDRNEEGKLSPCFLCGQPRKFPGRGMCKNCYQYANAKMRAHNASFEDAVEMTRKFLAGPRRRGRKKGISPRSI